MPPFIDKTGQKFGMLTVVKVSHRSKSKKYHWICKCECGGMKTVVGSNLISGNTSSCGCIWNKPVHGGYDTKLYKIWTSMKQRCSNTKNKAYKNYGGRGIKICREWENDFNRFKMDVGDKPTDKHTIERKDNNGNYCKENFTWATRKEQANNRRICNYEIINNITKTHKQWCEYYNFNYSTLKSRMERGWTFRQALFTKLYHDPI